MSKIEWTDVTWNPVTGCTPVSTGCKNCYAKKMHARLRGMHAIDKYAFPFDEIRCWKSELDRPAIWKKPKKIFVCSMSDLFHPDVKLIFILDVLYSVDIYNKHTFQFLTKRSYRFGDLCKLKFKLPDNAWLGVSVERAKYFHRIDDLKKTNAKVKFISFEPLLGPISYLDLSGIDWVIVGGENGPGARPMHPDWARGIRDQCSSMGIPFFFKDWGGTNKKAAGRLLDGVTHNAFPEAKS